MPKILVTNDDGVYADSIRALAAALDELGDVTVLAPERNWSAAGHPKTLHKPLRLKEVEWSDGRRVHACSGAPSDCVALAILGALGGTFDLVVSGSMTASTSAATFYTAGRWRRRWSPW